MEPDIKMGKRQSKVREFLRMSPPEFASSKLNEKLENFVDELQKVFEVMHVVDVDI